MPAVHRAWAGAQRKHRVYVCDCLIAICRTRLPFIYRRPHISVQEHLETVRCGVSANQGIRLVIPIAIVGGGGWGTALAITMARLERDVRLWVYEPYLVETMIATGENPIYLPSVRI